MKRCITSLLCATASLTALPAPADTPAVVASITVPDGFTVESAAAPGLSSYPMFLELDPQGNLYTAESTGTDTKADEMIANPSFMILKLTDTDGDGTYDSKTTFADALTFPMGVLWRQGAIYVAAPPDFVRLRDTDGDGVADDREVLLTGWNMRNSASLHGPFLGPDGWIYLTHGRHGYDITSKEGVHFEGLASRIWRCKPDGTQLERMAGGAFDNPVEIIFTPAGETIGTMTYFRDPAQGQRDALMHWVEGGVFPKPGESMAEFVRTGPLMPVMTKFARIAPSGLVRLQGTGWGEDYENNLFSAQFNPHRIQRHKLFRDGATYRTEDSDFLTSSDPDFHPTDVMQDADGSLLLCDTGGWYVDACPVSRISKPESTGGIYRIRKSGVTAPADPWGKSIDFAGAPVDDLIPLLADARPQVVRQAFDQLLARGEDAAEALAETIAPMVAASEEHEEAEEHEGDTEARDKEAEEREEREKEERDAVARVENPAYSDNAALRLQAVWLLGQLGGDDAAKAVRQALVDPDADVRVAAARMSGLNEDRQAIPWLSPLLFDPEPAVRRQAATSLGSLHAIEAAYLIYMACAHAVDPFETHALTYAAIQMGVDNVAGLALSHTNPAVVRAAAISLDQMDGDLLGVGDVLPLLRSGDQTLRETGLWIASRHTDWSPALLAQMETAFTAPSFDPKNDGGLREILLAYSASAEAQQRIANLLGEESVDVPRKQFLLGIVEAAPLDTLPDVWIAALGALIERGPEALRWPAAALVQARGIAAHDGLLLAQSADPSLPLAYRLHALAAIATRMESLDAGSAALVLDVLKDPESDPALRQTAGRICASAALDDGTVLALAQEVLPRADVLTLPNLLKAFAGKQDPALGQAVVDALKNSAIPPHLLNPAVLEPVLAGFPDSVKAAAEPMMAQYKAEEAARVAKLLDLEPLATTGEVGNGRRVFFGEKAACYTCHAIGDDGGHLGPDLTTVGVVRSAHDILESVLFPNASIVQDYETYTVETAWATYDGIISRQDADSITLKTGVGEEVHVNRADIESMSIAPISKMPEGLDTAISREELIDLITFLMSLNNDNWLVPVVPTEKGEHG